MLDKVHRRIIYLRIIHLAGCICRFRILSLTWIMLLLAAISYARAENSFLAMKEAFQISASEVPGIIVLHCEVAKGHYLYREGMKFTVSDDRIRLGTAHFPKGEVKYDEILDKEMEVYQGSIEIRIPVKGVFKPFSLNVTMRGCCVDQKICYPVLEKSLKISGLALRSKVPTIMKDGSSIRHDVPLDSREISLLEKGSDSSFVSRGDFRWLEDILMDSHLAFALVVFFVLGVLLAFTPCILPMLPILSSIVLRYATSRGSAISLAFAYVCGMALVNTAIGMIAGLLGQGLTPILQAPWMLMLFGFIMVLLSLSMFDFYKLQLPSQLCERINALAHREISGQFLSAAVMGMLSGLIVSPCVTPPLAATLAFIAKGGDVIFGGAILFFLSLGMGVPLLIVAAGHGALLPKAGPWMDCVKKFFGGMLLGVALWIVYPLLSTQVFLFAWSVLLLVSASFLRVFDSLPDSVNGFRRLLKGIGVVFALMGIVALLGAFTGARDPLKPLSGWMNWKDVISVVNTRDALTYIPVRNLEDLRRQLVIAGKPVMLFFHTDRCISCNQIERFTFSDPRVNAGLQEMVLLSVDVTSNTPADQELLKQFGLFGTPGIIFFDASGQEVPGSRVVGFQSADQFLNSLDVIRKTCFDISRS
ncbi:protein-disulfide reductase DsbD [Candidatus Pandoraea novymonadis]|uniref:Thiol:disulfide interchange protein DsbD n=1 Tax=Candidatus Pandoraea novymonadis TaxID=1808959 RepID=A0ABX5FE13_9BURK|nr:protein-disulfide reductase DsbD [Candidatus Pandoraea novymonadis]PSB91546.1 Thiol:disulfide interchange protein DsbD [Candidatus Pandoraea novymonadis]